MLESELLFYGDKLAIPDRLKHKWKFPVAIAVRRLVVSKVHSSWRDLDKMKMAPALKSTKYFHICGGLNRGTVRVSTGNSKAESDFE